MKVFCTGATGTIGDLLVSNLLKSGHTVTIITRDQSHVTNSWRNNVSIVEGDVTSKGDWAKALEGQDGIINLVGENVFAKRWTKDQKDRIYHSRVDATQNLVDAVMTLDPKPSVVVSVSGGDYYPSSKDKEFTETDENGDTFLGTVTKDWEHPVKTLEDTEIRHVIFRMGVAFTKSGGGAERMFLPHKFFFGGWIGSGKQVYSWIHIDDFVGLLQWGLENEESEGIYNGAAPDYKTMKELAEIGGQTMGRWTWTWVPGIMLKLVLGERADILLEGRAISSSKVREAGYEFKFAAAESALEDILKNF